jgi:hypothetical protein
LRVVDKVEVIRQIKIGKKIYGTGILSRELYDPNDLGKQNKIISAFEQNK